MEEEKKWLYKLLMLAVLIAALMQMPKRCGRGPAAEAVRTDTIRERVTDTIRVERPVERTCTVTRWMTVRVPVVRTDTFVLETGGPDSAEVRLPMEQRTYSDTSYTAWVSGYMARLDSIHVRTLRETVTITRNATGRRWHVGLQAGYGATLNGLSPYIGIGVTYNLTGR